MYTFSDLKVSSIFFFKTKSFRAWYIIKKNIPNALNQQCLFLLKSFPCLSYIPDLWLHWNIDPTKSYFCYKNRRFFNFLPNDSFMIFVSLKTFSSITFSNFILFSWSEIDLMLFYTVKRKRSIRKIVIV